MKETNVPTCKEKESIHQNLMEEAYKKWDDNDEIKKYLDFLDRVLKDLGEIHYQAVITGNLNYQVENGGFSQWDFNGYSCCLNDLIQFFEESFLDNKIITKILNLLYECRDVVEWVDDGFMEIEKISYEYKEFFQEKLEEYKEESLSKLDSRYYEIGDKFMEILERYFKNELNELKKKENNATEN
jgi:hypothetical protein